MANSLGVDVTIKVTPEALYAKSQNIASILAKVKGNFENMKGVMDKTGSYWIGEAGDAHREKYQEMVPKTEEIIRRLQEHVRDLDEMAGVYQEADALVQEIEELLPTDVIL